MNDLTVVDSIYLDAQQKEDVRRLSSLGYSPKDITVSLGLSLEDAGLFVRDAETVGTSVNFLIREGILVARAAPEIKLHEAAEGGNVEAIKQLEAVRKRHTFERLICKHNFRILNQRTSGGRIKGRQRTDRRKIWFD